MKRSSRQLRQVWNYLDGTARRSCKTCNQAAAHNAFGQIDFTPGSGSTAAAPRSGSATAIARLWKTVRASATRSSMRQEAASQALLSSPRQVQVPIPAASLEDISRRKSAFHARATRHVQGTDLLFQPVSCSGLATLEHSLHQCTSSSLKVA